MDDVTFSTLISRLAAASWTLHYPTNDTKMLTARINSQDVMLYNVRDPLYIMGLKPALTAAQTDEVLDLVESLIGNFSSQIAEAEAEESGDLSDAISNIIE